MACYPHLLRVKVTASCVVQLLHEATIHGDRIFRNVDRYQLPGALPASRNSHKGAACASATDLPIQDALASCASSRSLPSTFCRYKPYCIMYCSTFSGI